MAMKRASLAVLFVFIFAWLGCWQGIAQTSPVFVIDKPTILAFFPITQTEVDSHEDAGEALSDFDWYVSLAAKRLKNAGISIQVVNAPSFQIQMGKKTVTYQPKKDEIGYYFVAPGKKPHIERNVMTGEDILDAARKYFGVVVL
jgi:biotin operon repressor